MQQAYWMKHTKAPTFSALQEETDCDVVIIGAGMSGLSAAWFLAQEQQEVIVIEADRVAYGASGRNTGKLSAQHGLLYQRLMEKGRSGDAALYYQIQMEAITAISAICEKHHISCQLQHCDTCLYTNKQEHITYLEKEYACYRKLGIPSRLEKDENGNGAILYMQQQASFDPYAYLCGLAKILVDKGVRIYEHTPATAIEEQADGSYIVTAGDRFIHTRYIILATQFPFLDYGHFYFSFVVCEQQTLYHEPVQAWKVPALSIDEDALSTHTLENQRILTCCPQRSGDQEPLPTAEDIRQMTKRLYDSGWTSSDFVSLDGLPMIGKLEKHNDRILFATGYSKWGNTNGWAAGKLLCAYIMGHHPAGRILFSPQRSKPIFSLPYLQNSFHQIVRFISSRFLHEDHTFPDIEEGKPILLNNHIYGAYRDTKGELFLVDITCPHAGCICQFNHRDKTWDCPCHGSRFSYQGTIIKGPATCALHTIHEEHNTIDPHILR